MKGLLFFGGVLAMAWFSTSCLGQTSDGVPFESSAIEEARALLEPHRLDEQRATSWIVQLFATVALALLTALLLKVQFYTPRVATQDFTSQQGPRPAATPRAVGDHGESRLGPVPVSSRVVPGFSNSNQSSDDDGDFPA